MSGRFRPTVRDFTAWPKPAQARLIRSLYQPTPLPPSEPARWLGWRERLARMLWWLAHLGGLEWD